METLKMLGIALLAFIALLGIGFLSFYVFKVLKILADKFLSEKVSGRVKDAWCKLEIVVRNVVDADTKVYEEEFIKAMADGKLEPKELQDIADKLAKKTMELIAPDVETLKKFFVGEGLADFILNAIKGYIKSNVFAKLSKKIDPFVSNLKQPTQSSENGDVQPPK